MKVYDKHQVLTQVVCNRCGKELAVENGLLLDAVYEGKQTFGYFSKKDGTEHQFELCEECYDEWISTFRIPVSETEVTELL